MTAALLPRRMILVRSDSTLVHDSDFTTGFWRLVDQGGGTSACWLWTGRLHHGIPITYVPIRVRGDRHFDQPAVRIAWELVRGSLSPNMMLKRVCLGGARCIAPHHRVPITCRTRRRTGQRLTPDQVQRIKAMLAGSGATQAELAREYHVAKSTISRYASAVRRHAA